MTQEEILLFTLEQLDDLRIPYYVTGSVAVSIYGKPRFTHDIDIVISIYPTHISSLVEKCKSQFYISSDGLRDALQHHSVANLLHHSTGLKIDLWIPDLQQEYARAQFDRRHKEIAFGREIYFISPEDLLVQKLLWFKESESPRDWEDAVGIWELLRESLDRQYIDQWATHLSISSSWHQLSTHS
jgi:hypothetical protein